MTMETKLHKILYLMAEFGAINKSAIAEAVTIGVSPQGFEELGGKEGVTATFRSVRESWKVRPIYGLDYPDIAFIF